MIMKYDEAYDKGYFKALLDFKNYLDSVSGGILKFNSKKKYENFVKTSLNVLTTDSYVRDNWREMGGQFDNGKVFVNPNDGTVFVKKKLKGGD